MADTAPTTTSHGDGDAQVDGSSTKDEWEADKYFDAPGVLEMAQALSKWLQSQPWWEDNADILDYGCGPGTLLMELAAKTKSITGIDTSKSMIDHFKSDVAKASLTNATAVVATTEDGSELASDSADVAMVNCVLPHTSKPKAIIANLARAVRLGGHVTVAEMAATEHMTEHVEDGYEMSFCKPEDIHGWFKAAGIEVIGEPKLVTIMSDKDASFSMDVMFIAGCKQKAMAASIDNTATTAAAAAKK